MLERKGYFFGTTAPNIPLPKVLTLFSFQGSDSHLYVAALESMRDLIRSSTTSMTSVPMPLKFLRSHYSSLKDSCLQMKDPKAHELCSSIVSVLAMGQQDEPGARECLKFCLLAKQKDVGDWGHEYIR